ncbi:DEAD/DEAH box helicase [Ulvibacter antarcticus]|uniref:ATP-dependent RNA helicase RhlE n=1 Tax=Ulvibacter antarcticus TaxID=442714 RepID=A0A3L9ZCN5_9FLAO|nr:DEAD/DEAH box helicase [Ulvibacter antarcticus]RMA64412.1 ATP-dependent RNA helicase RhlE [Ulvibacter antarcticus]
MSAFEDLKLNKFLHNAIDDLGFETPTPIQSEAFSVVMSGKDMVGIAQTGTGKTLAYMLPILQSMRFSKEPNLRVLVLVPTRELVIQVVEEIEKFAKYMPQRVVGVYGGTNINTQKKALDEGADIIVATPGRFYDLCLSRVIQLKTVRKLVIDEVDVMLDLGFRFQLTNIFELLPERRQNIMFSATMTEDVDVLINDFFINPKKVSVAISGTPLENITQHSYAVPNFYTKVNLLIDLLKDKEVFSKVLVFVSNKRSADRLFEELEEPYGEESCLIHSNKTQNYRIRSINQFDEGKNRIMVATDVMARGLDLDKITHVINFDTPRYPENYMHRIGRTGRAEKEGRSLLFHTEFETPFKDSIEKLMDYSIPKLEIPSNIEVSKRLTPEEQPAIVEINNPHKAAVIETKGASFHEKSEKNSKENQGGSYRAKIEKKYKKPKTRGDKNYNKRNKR